MISAGVVELEYTAGFKPAVLTGNCGFKSHHSHTYNYGPGEDHESPPEPIQTGQTTEPNVAIRLSFLCPEISRGDFHVLCNQCKTSCQKHGKDRKRKQRFICLNCKRTYVEPSPKPLGSLYTPIERVVSALAMLCEGTSVRSAERLTGLHRDTILRLLVAAGQKCERLMGRLVVNVPVRDVECDEIWAFVQKKEGHKREEEKYNEGIGDGYCFVAMERHTKLIINFALGRRNQTTTNVFVEGLRDAVKPGHSFRLTTDGIGSYPYSIDNTLGHRVDYAQLIKVYRAPVEGQAHCPAEVVSTEVVPVIGNPDPKRVCTSIVERQNLTIRMQMRRPTRLTNGFSKKWENLWAAYCLHFAYYNFCRIHRSIRVTPAMESGIADHVWDLAELLNARI